jgi:prophage antirepressor-like protein
MEIIKAFQKNEIGINITIKGTNECPLFRASDIGEVLDIYNIRQNIQEFDITEKDAVCLTDSMGREQEVTFLTEKGLYKVLFRSRKPIAKQFTDWVCEVIKEVRINGKYDLENQLKEKNQEIQKILDGNTVDINDYAGKPVVYLIDMKETVDGEKLYRIGNSGDVVERFRTHSLKLKDTKNDIVFKNCWDFLDISIAVEVETKIKRHIKGENIMYKYRDNSTEIFKTDKIGIIESLINKWAEECTEKYIENAKNKSDRIYIEKLNAETNKKNADIEYLKQFDILLKQGVPVEKLISENKYQEPAQKIITKKEIIPKIPVPDGIKCSGCRSIKSQTEFDTNEQTLQLHANCNVCRKKASDKNMENIKEDYKKHQQHQKEIVAQRQKILDQEIICKCKRANCKSKSPEEFGINRATNSLYKVCRKCRGEEGLDLNIYDPNNPECTKCYHNFELDSDAYFKQCEICRKKWRENFEITPEEHEKKLLHKKEYYSKNKESIRENQKEYYSNNSKEIIQKKKKKSLAT